MKLINVASRPITNETLPAVLTTAAAFVVVGLTAWQAVAIRGLLPGRTSVLQQEVTALEAELPRLRDEAASARQTKPDVATLRQWKTLKGIVDERAFSWTRLFARLEQVLPPGVRVVAIAPESREGAMSLHITAIAQTQEAGLAFLARLQARPEFKDVYPLRVSDEAGRGGKAFEYVMRYDSAADTGEIGAPAAATTSSPEDATPDTEPAADGAEAPA